MIQTISSAILTPIRALKARYIPLLLIYFAYGFQTVTSVTLTFWEKENLSLSTEEFIMISAWVTMPWTLKMIFGQLVDNFKIFGSKRKAYIVIGSILLSLGYLMLMGMMVQHPAVTWMGNQFTMYLAANLLLMFGFVVQDVTADTMTTEVVEREGKSDDQIRAELTMVQILGRLSLMISGVVAAFMTGWLATIFESNPQNIIWIALLIPLISILGALFVRLEITDHPEHGKFNKTVMTGGLLYAAFMLLMAFWSKMVGSASGVIGTILQSLSPYTQELTFIVSAILLVYLLFWILKDETKQRKKTIFLVLLAIFIFRATPSVGPGTTWWLIDTFNFDREFIGMLQIISAIVPLVILWVFANFIASKPVRSVLIFLTIITAILSLPELGLFYGFHEMLGLSPRLVAIVDQAWDSPILHISMIPMLAIIAYYAPSHSRATWFAVAASFMNLATTAGSLGTKYLNKIFIISREVKDASGAVITPMDYSELGLLMITVIGVSLILPLLGIWLFLKKGRRDRLSD